MSDTPTKQTTIAALDAAEADPRLRGEREAAWQALFGGPSACAKLPDERCLPDCEYGIVGPCRRSV